jgi:hypothetical protein
MLSEDDKLDMVQAICYIMCKAEQEGTSHRGLMDALGIYPAGFLIHDLMDTLYYSTVYCFCRLQNKTIAIKCQEEFL